MRNTKSFACVGGEDACPENKTICCCFCDAKCNERCDAHEKSAVMELCRRIAEKQEERKGNRYDSRKNKNRRDYQNDTLHETWTGSRGTTDEQKNSSGA